MNGSAYQSSTYNHLGQHTTIGPSNLKIFHGEDLTYGDRKRLQQLQQQDWLNQQVEEKDEIKRQNRNIKDAHDMNTKTITDMRTELEIEKARRLREMQQATKATNRQQLEEKLNLERLRRTEDTIDKLNHIDYVTNNDFYTENTATCQSMLGRNRVLPYHWKGMNEQQRQAILLEQQRQRKEREMQSQLEKQEERLFAQQQKAQRKMLLKIDRAKNRGLNDLRKGVDEYNLLKAEQMKRKVFHAYDELQTFKNE